MPPIYAIGDVHGQFDMLADALERIEADGGPDAKVVILGDLVDRGSNSFGVVELLRLGIEAGNDWTVVRGNHDQMFFDFVTKGELHHPRILSKRTWLDPALGGLATLKSYNVDIDADPDELLAQARAKVPETHLEFLGGLPAAYETDGFLFVHAGIRPGVPLDEQDFDDLIWIRDPFLSHQERFDWFVVHGHTSLEAPQLYRNRLNLDGGAGHGRELATAVLDEYGVFLLTRNGRMAL